MQIPMKTYDFNKFMGKKTIILGNLNSEKTRLLCKILEDGAARQYRGITAIDMAPQRNMKGAGRNSLLESIAYLDRIRLLVPRRVYEPRIEGADRREINQLAVWNAKNIAVQLRKFISSPTRALFMNDVTMYLHMGPLAILLKAISKSHTFIGTAFRGTIFLDDLETGISRREKKLVDRLTCYMDEVISI